MEGERRLENWALLLFTIMLVTYFKYEKKIKYNMIMLHGGRGRGSRAHKDLR